MNKLLLVRPTFGSFAKATTVFILSVVVVNIVLLLMNSLPKPLHQFGWNHYMPFGISIAIIVFVMPAVETFIIIGSTRWAAKSVHSYWLICCLGALPLALMHIYDGWTKPLDVVLAFIWSAHCYLQLQPETTFKKSYLFLVGIHSVSNAFFLGVTLLSAAALQAQQHALR